MAALPRHRKTLASLPLRPLSGVYFRQTAIGRQPLDLPPTAGYSGRWHDEGDPAPLYAASSGIAAMLEVVRSIELEPDVDPPFPQRLLSELVVSDLSVVDLANDLALDLLELRHDDLTRGADGGLHAAICREIAREVRRRKDAQGLLVPSAALPGAKVLVVFPQAFEAITVGRQVIGRLELALEGQAADDSR